MREPKFDIGDIVKLAAGGPDMSIKDVIYNHRDEFTGRIRAQWFAGKKLEQGEFAEETLTLVTKVAP
jgi:uncharacterized protein YodC (DUF2158 family)